MHHGWIGGATIAGILLASSLGAQMTPSLVLEGTGTLGPTDAMCTRSARTCSGQFNAVVSGQLAQLVSSGALHLDIEIQNDPLDQTGTLRKIKGLEGMLEQLERQIQALKREIRSMRAAGGAPMGDGLPFGCSNATGTGTFEGSGYSVGFTGEFCVFSSSQVELSGSVRIVQTPASAEPATWATGTLTASGALHTFMFGTDGPNPIPGSGPMVVGLVGAVGEVPSIVP